MILFGILFGGISALFASVDYLFEVSINYRYYMDVWFILAFLASIFVMVWIPADVQKLDRLSSYPKFLKVLNEYFLLPLTSVYLLVLYAYCAKILFTSTWPKGGVGLWIIGFSTVGVIVYFLAHSIKESFFRYIEFYKRWFFLALLPLLAVLFLAIGIRIQAYGVTIDRYLVVLFGVWLLLMSLYFLISKGKNLKFITVSLFFLLLLAAYGPQSAFNVSSWSQKARLERLFNQYGILKDGRAVTENIPTAKISNEDGAQIYSIVHHLADYNEVEFFQQWFPNLKSDILDEKNDCFSDEERESYCKVSSWDIENRIFAILGIDDDYYYYNDYDIYADDYSETPGDPALNSSSTVTYYPYFQREKSCASGDGLCAMEVSGFDYYATTYVYGDEKRVVHADRDYMLYLSGDKRETILIMDGEKVILSTDLKTILDELVESYGKKSFYQVPADKMTIIFPRGQFNLYSIAARYDKDDNLISVDSLSGELLLKK